MDNFDPYNVLLSIATNIPVLLMTAFVNGCYFSIVQKKSNKVHPSIIKCASRGSGGRIKASCSESMRFCKKNIHIYSVINSNL